MERALASGEGTAAVVQRGAMLVEEPREAIGLLVPKGKSGLREPMKTMQLIRLS